MFDFTITPATGTDSGPVAKLIADAFDPLKVCRYLVPDDGDRHRILPRYFGLYVEEALEHGRIDILGDLTGVAVWFSRTGTPLPQDPGYDTRLAAITGEWVERFQDLDTQFDLYHPHTPHEHLALLAVRPDLQGKGLGGILLDQGHTRLDVAGLPAYLEASDTDSRRLYLRYGYTDHGDPIVLADGTPMFPMWRPAQPARSLHELAGTGS